MPDLLNGKIVNAQCDDNGHLNLIVEKNGKKFTLALGGRPDELVVELGSKSDVYEFISGATLGRIDKLHNFKRDPARFSDGSRAWELGYEVGWEYGMSTARKIARGNLKDIEKHPLIRKLIHKEPSIHEGPSPEPDMGL